MNVDLKSVLGYFEKSPVTAYGLTACLLGGALCGYLLLSPPNAEGLPEDATAPVDDDEPL